jgi:hypothetical protein
MENGIGNGDMKKVRPAPGVFLDRTRFACAPLGWSAGFRTTDYSLACRLLDCANFDNLRAKTLRIRSETPETQEARATRAPRRSIEHPPVSFVLSFAPRAPGAGRTIP